MVLARSSKTSIKTRPIILRFCSGSVTPVSSLRNLSLASIISTLRSSPLSRCITDTASPLRIKPVSTNKQCSLFPSARDTSTAATVESTPPLSAQRTCAVGPTCSETLLTDCSIKFSGVQSGKQPAMPCTKPCKICLPCGVCTTSG